MTREEEIKDKLSRYDVHYVNPLRDDCYIWCNDDMLYLLARNEELQREKEKMQAVVDAAIEWEKCHKKGSKSIDIFAVVKTADNLRSALDELDAKEQDDD